MQIKLKRFISILLLITIIIPFGSYSVVATETDEISVFLNGNRLTFDMPPIIVDGRTLVPMRKIFEELAYIVDWNESKQRVTAVKGDLSIQLDIGDTLVILDDYESVAELDVPAQIIDGRTMVPLRFVASVSGCDVLWDSEHNAIHIKSRIFSENARPNQIIAVNDDILYNSGHRFTFDGSVFEASVAAASDSLQIYDGQLYYFNVNRFICTEDVNARNEAAYNSDKIPVGVADGKMIYADSNGSIYTEEIDTSDEIVVVARPVESLLVVDDKIYYIDLKTKFLYQINLSGTDEKVVVNEPCGEYLVVEGKIYYKSFDNSNLKEHSIDSGETVTIYDGVTTCFDVKYVALHNGSEHGWYQVYYSDATKGDGLRFYDKYDYQGIIEEEIYADKLWIYGDDIIYRAANADGSYSLFRYGRFGVYSYNIPIVTNIIGDVELHNGKLFYVAEGMTMSDKTPEWFMANVDGSNPIPIMLFAFSSISYSHVDGNVPDAEHFDEYLQRDLDKYFSDKGAVKYILLRRTPSQVGMGYPYFYVWVTVLDESGNTVTEGAARLGAGEKEGFFVTHFITKEQILEDTSTVTDLFPLILHKRILELAGL